MRGITTFQAVLVFALAAAVAVLILASAGGMFPSVKPYGEPMPYVSFKNTSRGIQLGVFDYAGFVPKAAHIYVNGRYAGSARSFSKEGNAVGAWTDVYVKCGDWVEALVQYDGFQKKLEGRVRCSKPLESPFSSAKVCDPYAVFLAEVYNALNGYANQSGIPLRVYMRCDLDYVDKKIWTYIYAEVDKPDAVVCSEKGLRGREIGYRYTTEEYSPGCGRRIALADRVLGGGYALNTSLAFYRPITALVTNFFGGAEVPTVVAIFGTNDYVEAWVKIGSNNWAKLGYCSLPRLEEEYREWQVNATGQREKPASGVYHFFAVKGDGTLVDVTLIIWKREDGTYGYKIVSTETDYKTNYTSGLYVPMPTDNSEYVLVPVSSLVDAMSKGAIVGQDFNTIVDFIFYLHNSDQEGAVLGLLNGWFGTSVYERDVPYETYTYTVTIRQSVANTVGGGVQYNDVFVTVGVLDMAVLGAALATSVLPPPDLPQVVVPLNATGWGIIAH